MERMKFVSKSVGTLVCSTVVSCVLFNIITASQYMSIILGGRLFIGEFKKKDMLPQTLSRCLEDGGTVTSLIVPWNVDAPSQELRWACRCFPSCRLPYLTGLFRLCP